MIEVAVAQEDVAHAERIDLAGQQAAHHAEAAADVEQEGRASGLDQHGGLVALGVQGAAGAEEDDARALHRARG